jgi:hypothetical protein
MLASIGDLAKCPGRRFPAPDKLRSGLVSVKEGRRVESALEGRRVQEP